VDDQVDEIVDPCLLGFATGTFSGAFSRLLFRGGCAGDCEGEEDRVRAMATGCSDDIVGEQVLLVRWSNVKPGNQPKETKVTF
jgi:hypothetical protein